MDSLVVTLFAVLFCMCFLAPMLWLLITTGKQIRQTQHDMRKNEKEMRKLINRL